MRFAVDALQTNFRLVWRGCKVFGRFRLCAGSPLCQRRNGAGSEAGSGPCSPSLLSHDGASQKLWASGTTSQSRGEPKSHSSQRLENTEREWPLALNMVPFSEGGAGPMARAGRAGGPAKAVRAGAVLPKGRRRRVGISAPPKSPESLKGSSEAHHW